MFIIEMQSEDGDLVDNESEHCSFGGAPGSRAVIEGKFTWQEARILESP